MSKFTRIINTFKNGLVSPRLRGIISEPSDGCSAEVLENFIVDRTGAIHKRGGFELLKKTAIGTTSKKYFEFNLLGKDYLISFDQNKYFNDVDADFFSTYAKIEFGDSSIPTGIRVFGTGTTTNATTSTDLHMWNGRHDTNGFYHDTGLTTFLTEKLTIIHAEKISDRTIVFTTSGFSFLLSILDYNVSGSTIKREMILYPYFVSSVLLAQTLGKGISSNVKCPISPTNFPWNSINTDTSIVVSAGENVSGTSNTIHFQSGASADAGVLVNSSNRLSAFITVPKSVSYVNNVLVSLVGRFVSIPDIANNTKEVIYLILRQDNISGSNFTYYGIQITGGVPLSTSTAWKFSTWGNGAHPKAVGYCFGRLMYGNTDLSTSQWWASATHPNNLQYFQGFKSSALDQDATSDFSGLNYAGVSVSLLSTPNTKTAIQDIYRFGFSDFAPNFGAINWITSRRRIHLGTSKGESQITVSSGDYNAASYTQNVVGTDRSSLGKVASGSRRIFYISNTNFTSNNIEFGLEVREISTEDKDYESIDVVASAALHGLDLVFSKIEWVEELGALICQTIDIGGTENSRYFILSIYNDTKIKAFSEIVTTKNIVDSAGSYFILRDDTYEYITQLLPNPKNGLINNCYGDIYTTVLGSSDVAAGAFSNYYGKTVTLYHNGVETLFEVPSSSFSYTVVPVDWDTVSIGNELFIIEDKFSSKLKTLPIHEGAKFGSSVGDVQRVDRVTVMIDKSGAFKYGSDENSLISSEGLGVSDTKLVTVDFPQSPDREQFIYIESSDPTPLNISGISLRGVSYSGE